ncbi:MAG: hypothetical protein QNJ53_18395 [Pleurocapsa sp. MO_192.B19]|nr:hypothetical protein [Pleurocapsa sp. MO_192.B19]
MLGLHNLAASFFYSQFLQQVARETINCDLDRLELSTEFRARNPQIEQLAMNPKAYRQS